jgi:ArsR family metal-binding transcriptional regulator
LLSLGVITSLTHIGKHENIIEAHSIGSISVTQIKNYEIAEKSLQGKSTKQQFEGNTTMSAVITESRSQSVRPSPSSQLTVTSCHDFISS